MINIWLGKNFLSFKLEDLRSVYTTISKTGRESNVNDMDGLHLSLVLQIGTKEYEARKLFSNLASDRVRRDEREINLQSAQKLIHLMFEKLPRVKISKAYEKRDELVLNEETLKEFFLNEIGVFFKEEKKSFVVNKDNVGLMEDSLQINKGVLNVDKLNSIPSLGVSMRKSDDKIFAKVHEVEFEFTTMDDLWDKFFYSNTVKEVDNETR